jgi:transposase
MGSCGKLLDWQRKRKYDLRQILNGILYLLDNGVKWRSLPKEYPRWQSVYYYFRKWSKDATLQKVQQSLLAELRVKQKREAQPSLATIDSQTLRTSKLADQQTVGINGHRWIKGRKRRLLVEVKGHLLSVQIQPANLPDEIGAWPVNPIRQGSQENSCRLRLWQWSTQRPVLGSQSHRTRNLRKKGPNGRSLPLAFWLGAATQ